MDYFGVVIKVGEVGHWLKYYQVVSFVAQKKYTEEAKKSLDKYNLNTDVMQIAHALLTTPILSDNSYRKSYNDQVKGRGVSGIGVDFYPHYIKAADNTKLASKVWLVTLKQLVNIRQYLAKGFIEIYASKLMILYGFKCSQFRLFC